MQEQKAPSMAVAVEMEQSEPLITRYRLDQRLLHWIHTIAFVGLVGTGIPLLPFRRLPFDLDFRGWIGGYSSLIMSWHTWLAIGFISLPSAVFLVGWFVGRDGLRKDKGPESAGRRGLSRPSFRARSLNLAKSVHVWITILMASAFAVTGSVMWARDYVSFQIVEWSYYFHDILTYLSIPFILGHLLVLHLLGAPEAMRGMITGKVRREWAESVALAPLEDK